MSVITQRDCETTGKKNNKKQTHPVRLHAVDKYENAENVNTQNGYGTMSKK